MHAIEDQSAAILPIESNFDRLPPHDLEAEKAVLHAVVNSGGDRVMLAEIRSIVQPESFFSADHQEIFRVLCQMADGCESIGPMQLAAELKRRHLLEELGGYRYLAEFVSSLGARTGAFEVAMGTHFARDVAECAKLRRLITLANDLLSRCYRPYRRADDLPAVILSEIDTAVGQMRASSSGAEIKPLGIVLDGVLDDLLGGGCPRIATGIRLLDETTGGGAGIGEYFLIAGRPSMGKSLLSKQIARNVASAGTPVGYISVEESSQKFARNFIASTAEIENRLVRAGSFTHDQWQRVYKSIADAHDLPLFITDRSMRIGDICNAITLMVAKHHCRMIVVDYVQLIEAEHSTRSREQEVAALSRRLKNLFRQLSVAGVVVAQLNRASETGGIRPPRMSDLRDSGQLEQDADAIILIHRPGYYARDSEDPAAAAEDRRAFLIPAKVRDASREDDIELFANLEYQRFDDAQPSNGRTVPPMSKPFSSNKLTTRKQAQDLVMLLAKKCNVTQSAARLLTDSLSEFPFAQAREVVLAHAPGNGYAEVQTILAELRSAT